MDISSITAFVQPVPPPTEFNGRLFGPVELLKKAWVVYKSRFWTLLGIYLFPVLFFLLLGVVFGLNIAFVHTPLKNYFTTILAILAIIGYILYVFWFMLAEIYAIAHADSCPGVKESFSHTRSLIFASWWLVILQGAILYGLMLLFVIPGLIFSVWVSFAVYILVNENIRGIDSLLKSREYVRGHWWGVLGRIAALSLMPALIYIPSSILSSIGSALHISLMSLLASVLNLFVIPFYPLMFAWNYELYKNLKELRGDFVFKPSKSTKTWWTVFGVLGALLISVALIFVIVFAISNSVTKNSKPRDLQRQSDIAKLELSLEK